MSERPLNEPTLSSRTIYDGHIIRVEALVVALPNGKEGHREVVRHPGAVAIVASPKPGYLMFVEQYRKAPGEVLLELPAGKLEAGEQPVAAAARELAEETGYRCQRLQLLYAFYTSPGFADEKIHLFYADQLTPGAVQLDEDEFVNVRMLSESDLRARMEAGQLRDAKTLIGVQWWLSQLTDGQTLDGSRTSRA